MKPSCRSYRCLNTHTKFSLLGTNQKCLIFMYNWHFSLERRAVGKIQDLNEWKIPVKPYRTPPSSNTQSSATQKCCGVVYFVFFCIIIFTVRFFFNWKFIILCVKCFILYYYIYRNVIPQYLNSLITRRKTIKHEISNCPLPLIFQYTAMFSNNAAIPPCLHIPALLHRIGGYRMLSTLWCNQIGTVL